MSEADDATLPDSRPSSPPAARSAAVDLGERYELGAVIGRGGMGEIRLARDVRIKREVAVKLMISPQRDEATLGRFFREAHVQGVLEHPSVVPVHDLGIDAAGNPYFVMKRLAGTTLADVLLSTDPEVATRWPRRQLLARLVDVCLAIEFAHTHGVIHRDLKPANLMLGDFGEAYVLDWGLARVAGEHDAGPRVAPLPGDHPGQTQTGDLLGTPGYMSPEQARGEVVDRRTDVFALGCVLFEILAGSPALPRGLPGLAEAIAAAEHRPSRCAPEIPPELDDLSARATAAAPDARPTARELADGIQAYLDGDRDTVRRRELAATHAEAARAAMEETGDEARATAMREAGRAFALDPSNALAQLVLGRLLLEAPVTLPAGALVTADAERGEIRQTVLRTAARGFVGLLVGVLALLVLDLHAVWPVIGLAILTGATSLALHLVARKPLPMRSPAFLVLLLLTSLLLTVAGMLFGPLLFMPLFIIGALSGFLSQHVDYPPSITIAALVAPLVAVLGLELAGVLPQSIRFEDGQLVLKSWLIELTPTSTAVILGLAIVMEIVNTVFIALIGRRSQERAQNVVHAQTWHMKQLLPRASDSVAGRSPAP